jgi:N,N'-diacetyllegionaminate synthase
MIMSVYIIAEAGVNHNGSIENAKKLIDAAVSAGADSVKFQTFIAENLVTENVGKAEYQKQEAGSDESQLKMLKKLELSFDEFKELQSYCEDKSIDFLSTAFDFDSIDFLNDIGIKKWKVPSGDITNLPFLVKIARTQKPVILSTGMSDMTEIREAINILKQHGTEDLTVLHCTSEYPAPYKEVNLKAMNSIAEAFGVEVGYSDHTKGIEIPVAAVAMGAQIIEKHFTLDNNMEGPDHKASLEPSELKKMVSSIRNVELAMGTGEKKPVPSEEKNKMLVRKSIIASRKIEKGELFTEKNLTVKRPGTGVSPMKWFEILGRNSTKNYIKDELITDE